MRALAHGLWLASPVILAGAMHIAAIHANLLAPLARVPLDASMTVRGRRVFGANKTLRGLLMTIVLTIACAAGQFWLVGSAGWARALTPEAVLDAGPLKWGALLGGGYVIGELPNSFLKRQLDIGPGQAGRGWTGVVFWIADQIDSLAGALVAMSLVWTPPLSVVIALLVVTLSIHPLAAWAMVLLGLKDRIG